MRGRGGRTTAAATARSLLGVLLPVVISSVVVLSRRLAGLDPSRLSEAAAARSEAVWGLLSSDWRRRPGNGRDPDAPGSEGGSTGRSDDWRFHSWTNDDESLRGTWLDSYFQFHTEARKDFPGASLLTNPSSPGVLLRHCGPKSGMGGVGGRKVRNYFCGGLADRLSTLPFDLYLANATGRVLLLRWDIPHPLESFLIPSGDVDWTFPRGSNLLDDDDDNGASIDGTPTFDVGFDFLAGDKFPALFGMALRDLLRSKDKVYRISSPSSGTGNRYMEKRLAACGAVPSSNLFEPPVFGAIFRRLFRPSLALRGAIDDATARHFLRIGSYSAVHLRLRHPLGWGRRIVGRDGNSTADRSGLPFSGRTRSVAIAVASNAVECAIGNPPSPARMSNRSAPEPLYMFSDSNDTVALFVDPEKSPFAGHRRVRIVSRDVSFEALHLAYDDGLRHPPASFLGMFVDLFVAAAARCITYDGIGGFGTLAWRIGGTNCTSRHREAGGASSGQAGGNFACKRM